jgi:hypothetical protein
LRQNGPPWAVGTDANMPIRDGAPRCSRQPEISGDPWSGLREGEAPDNSGDFASIIRRMHEIVFIATHLQVHLVG